jgi:hypothetical protein
MQLGMHYTYVLLLGAARNNEIAVVQFLRAQGLFWNNHEFNLAAARGHIDMCAYLYAERCPWRGNLC